MTSLAIAVRSSAPRGVSSSKAIIPRVASVLCSAVATPSRSSPPDGPYPFASQQTVLLPPRGVLSFQLTSVCLRPFASATGFWLDAVAHCAVSVPRVLPSWPLSAFIGALFITTTGSSAPATVSVHLAFPLVLPLPVPSYRIVAGFLG